MGIGRLLSNIAKDAEIIGEGAIHTGRAAGKAIGKGMFKEMSQEAIDASMDIGENLLGVKMKAIPQAALAVGLVGFSLANTGIQLKNSAATGQIEAGGPANMVSSNPSPYITNEAATKNMKGHLNSYGADGDIVFAMHNLR